MLKQTNYKANDVVTIKLLSGEEVIGYFVKDDMAGITLRKPVVPVPTGQGSMGLAPYLMSSDYLKDGGELTFAANTVVTSDKTSQQFADAYSQQVSGLAQAPSKPGLITS